MKLLTAHKILKRSGFEFGGIADANYPRWRGLAYWYRNDMLIIWRRDLKGSCKELANRLSEFKTKVNRRCIKLVYNRVEFTLSSPRRGNLKLVA